MLDTRLGMSDDLRLVFRSEVLDCCVAPKFARHGVVVYRIGDRAGERGPNLLRNPGFETVTSQGEVEEWSV